MTTDPGPARGNFHEGHVSLEASKHQPEPGGGCTCGFCAYSSEHVAVMVWRDLIEPHVTAQVEQRGAEIALLRGLHADGCIQTITEARAAVAREATARRDALAPVLALCDSFDPTCGSGRTRTFVADLRAAVESPDRPEGEK